MFGVSYGGHTEVGTKAQAAAWYAQVTCIDQTVGVDFGRWIECYNKGASEYTKLCVCK